MDVMVLESRVMAADRAMKVPLIVLPAPEVMLAAAMTEPAREVVAPSVAEVPTCAMQWRQGAECGACENGLHASGLHICT